MEKHWLAAVLLAAGAAITAHGMLRLALRRGTGREALDAALVGLCVAGVGVSRVIGTTGSSLVLLASAAALLAVVLRRKKGTTL
jgi:hypothetical protein